MSHAFDPWGWYVGAAADGAPRSTPTAPANTSPSETPGAARANWTGHEWIELPYAVPAAAADMRPLLRAELWDRIKAERDRRAQAGGYVAGGKWFHSDTFSRTQQLGLVLLGASLPAGLQWKTMDGTFVAMTQALAAQVFAAAAASDQALFAHAEALRMAVDAAEDPSSVDIVAGWPPVFGEV